MKSKYALLSLLMGSTLSLAAAPQLIEYQVTGAKDKRINIMFLGDGYTANEKSKFLSDVATFRNALLDAPWSSYTNYFNSYALFAESRQSGASKEDGSTIKDTAYKCKYWTSNLERLLTCDTTLTTAAKRQYLPEADIVLVVVNSTKYGGSGGLIAVANSSSPQIVAHEVGHSFVGLADEYEYAGGSATEDPNSTQIISPRTALKWNHWVDISTPLLTPETAAYGSIVGAFEGAAYQATGWYRPTLNSRMRNNGAPLGAVNSEQFVLAMYGAVSPIDATQPVAGTVLWQGPGTLSVTLKQPNGSDLAVEWWVNGIKTAETGKSFNGSQLPLSGSAKVEVKVMDRTPLVRKDPQGLLEDTVSWTVQVGASTPSPTPVATAKPTAVPTAIPTPTSTPSPSATPVATAKPTAVPTAIPTPTSTPSPSATPVATVKPTAVPTAIPTPTSTPSPSKAPTATPGNTCSAPAWQSGKEYVSGAIVSFNGQQFRAKWWTLNAPKVEAYGPWELLGACSTQAVTTSPAATPTPTPIASTKPIATPVSSATPASASCAAPWNKAMIYIGKEIVSYQGSRYQAKWWTNGNVPGAEQYGPWQLLGACP